jgi:acyl-coenzyme A thioesterase PaaI-like protein
VRYLAPARVGPFTAAAEITGVMGEVAVVRIRVTDDGQGGRDVILADTHVVRA